MRGAADNRGDGGFTLVEVMVAVLILALLAALLPSTVQLARTAWHSSRQLQEATYTGPVRHYLETTLTAMKPVYKRGERGNSELAFDGRNDAIAFVADVVDDAVLPGPMLHRILSQDIDGRLALIVQRQPFMAGHWPDSATDAQHIVLLDHITEVRFRYLERQTVNGDAIAVWRESWPDRNRLPSLVEMRVIVEKGQAPFGHVIVVEPRLRRPI